jgi:26S proteasome regulatory subunit N3
VSFFDPSFEIGFALTTTWTVPLALACSHQPNLRVCLHSQAIIVQLLMGDVPERTTFDHDDLKDALKPYLELTNAVRVGDLISFQKVVDAHVPLFQTDKTYTLILRLRHNVIKTGLRKINISYSAISLEDVYKKLGLNNVEEAESVCAKAIFDGVIDATIDFDQQALLSNDTLDIYCTSDPYQNFHKRITFCLDVHNEVRPNRHILQS